MPLPFQSGPTGDQLSNLLRAALDPPPVGSALLQPFWDEHALRTEAWPIPYDQAVIGGVYAPSLGLAFVAGYQAAGRRLVPALSPKHLVSLAVTERKGTHPRAIETRLEAGRLHGEKVFATLAGPGRPLMVLARVGERSGRPELKLFLLNGDEDGLTFNQGPRPVFVPEITHAIVKFDGVVAPEPLEGDGWADYVKPFRTLEDIHVCAAFLAWVVAMAGRLGWDQALRESLLGKLAGGRALATSNARSTPIHIAVAGWMDDVQTAMSEAPWEDAPDEIRAAWERDRVLLGVASKARKDRLQRAWERL